MDIKRKELLLKDLSARLIYGVKCFVYGDIQNTHILSGIKDDDTAYFKELDWKESDGFVEIEFVTPLLRPMSSMTDDEKKFVANLKGGLVVLRHKETNDIVGVWNETEATDWLNKNHFDYRNLIDNGLAAEAPAGMYK